MHLTSVLSTLCSGKRPMGPVSSSSRQGRDIASFGACRRPSSLPATGCPTSGSGRRPEGHHLPPPRLTNAQGPGGRPITECLSILYLPGCPCFLPGTFQRSPFPVSAGKQSAQGGGSHLVEVWWPQRLQLGVPRGKVEGWTLMQVCGCTVPPDKLSRKENPGCCYC